MRSSSIFCDGEPPCRRRRGRRRIPHGALAALLVLAVTAVQPPEGEAAKKKPRRSVEELTNLFLGPHYSQWLVGPIAALASDEEIAAYLALHDDAAARAWIEAFWRRRDPHPDRPGNTLRELFERRQAAADRLFAEGATLGRRTDRGTIWVLYGPPEDRRFETTTDPRDPPIEVWTYPRDAPAGLDGQQPRRLYTFARARGSDLTVLFTPRGRLPARRR